MKYTIKLGLAHHLRKRDRLTLVLIHVMESDLACEAAPFPSNVWESDEEGTANKIDTNRRLGGCSPERDYSHIITEQRGSFAPDATMRSGSWKLVERQILG